MLTLICGIPNAGKTTYSSQYNNVIHFDKIPHLNFNEQFVKCNHKAAKIKGDVCIEGVYNTIKRRKELLMACYHQDKKICIWLNTSLDECVRRERNYRRRPIRIVHSQYEKFEPPTLDEGWDEIIVIHEDGEKTIYKRGEANVL